MAAMKTEARGGMDPALYKAATQGSVGSLRKLVEKDVKILNSKTPQDNTALHLAALHGHADFAREVLAVSEELMVARNAEGDTALHLAAKTGRLKVAELLVGIARAWPDEPNSEYKLLKSPLMMTNREGNNPLHEAVRHRRGAVAVALLDADPMRSHDHDGHMESPLHMAAREGLVKVVQKILDYPWVDEAFESLPPVSLSGTALHQAVLGSHNGIVEILMEKRPYLLDLTDSDANNALHYAAQKNNRRVVEMLLNKRTDLAYKRNKEQESPLLVAARYGSSEAIKALLRVCPDVAEMADAQGRNAFHISVVSGKASALRCLLRHVRSAELLNRLDANGDTPLHLAASVNSAEYALLLLNDRRVDLCVRDHQGRTARNIVEIWRHDAGKTANADADAYQMHLFKQLKQQECKRCGKQKLPPTVSDRRRPLNNKDFDSVVDAYFLAATLIATVTFAATFTMPGGYDQTNGIALHGHNSAFKVFVVSNTVAMCSSIVVIFLLIWARQEPVMLRLHNFMWSQTLTIVACSGMLLSLMAVVYTTVAPTAPWLAYLTIAIGISSPALFCVISWMGR